MIAINLLPSVYLSARAARRRLRAWGLATVVLSAIYAVSIATYYATQGPRGPELTGRIAAVESRLTRTRQEIARTGATLRSKLAEQAAAHAVGTHPDYSVLLRLISSLREGQVALESVMIATSEPAAAVRGAKPAPGAPASPSIRLELSGLARTPSAVAGYVLRLEKTGLFTKVDLVETSPRAPGPARAVEATGFKVRATFAGETPKETPR